MSDFKIEKGIPIPPAQRTSRYPFHELERGDSFFCPGKTAQQLSAPRASAQKRLGWRFTVRTVDGGVRVWRVE